MHPHYRPVPGGLVLAKFSTYPPWPGRIIAPTKAAKKLKSKNKAGYPVRFFLDGTYAWIPDGALQELTLEDIDAFLAAKTKKQLRARLVKAYTEAQNSLKPLHRKRKREGSENGAPDMKGLQSKGADDWWNAMANNAKEREEITKSFLATNTASEAATSRFTQLLDEADRMVNRV
ncbi:hypothetical protein B0H13DRAFT_1911784 [Mycena leptocephala]|nr:hypothetical protein B0H13DRAFT_1911784 [Mycena leptocephala]